MGLLFLGVSDPEEKVIAILESNGWELLKYKNSFFDVPSSISCSERKVLVELDTKPFFYKDEGLFIQFYDASFLRYWSKYGIQKYAQNALVDPLSGVSSLETKILAFSSPFKDSSIFADEFRNIFSNAYLYDEVVDYSNCLVKSYSLL